MLFFEPGSVFATSRDPSSAISPVPSCPNPAPFRVEAETTRERPDRRRRVMQISKAVAILATVIICLGFSSGASAQTLKSRNSNLNEPRSAKSASLRINCEACQSSLLIIADQQCKLRVDAQPLGTLTAGEGKLVRVDPGDHLIQAQAADLVWNSTIHVEKPGQVIVQTGLKALRLASPWVGEWVGGIDYGDTQNIAGTIHYSHFFERFTFLIDHSGGCRLTEERHFDNSYARDGESPYALMQRVAASARTAHAFSAFVNCTITSGGGIEGPLVSVTSDGNLSFSECFADKRRVTVHLERKN
jgi:hypothetical protein